MIREVINSEGQVEPFDCTKLNRWVLWANQYNVDWSSIAQAAYRKCSDRCTTKDLQKALISACVDYETEDHLKVAGRLLAGDIYKRVFGGFRDIPNLFEYSIDMENKNYWAKMDYSAEEMEILDGYINHDKDLEYGYTSLKQMVDKYLIKDITKDELYESPQFMFMGIAMANMEKMPSDRRIGDVVKLYEYLSDMKINCPTPFLINLRTNKKKYSSCCVYKSDDTVGSLAAGDHIAYMMTAASAGIGSYIQTRSKGDPVDGGRVVHLGKTSLYRMGETAVSALKQGCYDSSTEVLTSSGWRSFDEVISNKELKVAQVHNNKEVEFVKPIGYYKFEHSGDMIRFTQKKQGNGNKCLDLVVTPNHRMTFRRNTQDDNATSHEMYSDKAHRLSNEYQVKSAEDLHVSRSIWFDCAGSKREGGRGFSAEDAFKIAYQADGYTLVHKGKEHNGVTFKFTKQRKVDRLTGILSELGYEFSKNVHESGATQFYVKCPEYPNKSFDWVDLENVTEEYSSAFLRELQYWDGAVQDSTKEAYLFSSTDEKCVDIVQSLCVLCGVHSKKRYRDSNKKNVKRCFNLSYSFNRSGFTGRGVKKEVVQYHGYVYCVEVPTGNIIVRRSGLTTVCGNSRGGSMTTYVNCLDPEIEEILLLKHPTTPVKKQVRGIDYALTTNKVFARKAAKNQKWMLVSYLYAPKLYEAMFGDADTFEKEYNRVLASDVPKKMVKARDILTQALIQGVETGRMYLFFADEANTHTPFIDKIYSSNL